MPEEALLWNLRKMRRNGEHRWNLSFGGCGQLHYSWEDCASLRRLGANSRRSMGRRFHEGVHDKADRNLEEDKVWRGGYLRGRRMGPSGGLRDFFPHFKPRS